MTTAMEREVWNKWIAAEDSSHLLAAERERAGAEGDWLIGFLYIDHTAGLSVRLDSWARKTWMGRLHQTKLVSRDEMLIVRYGVLQKLELHVLSNRDRARFSLPVEPDWLGVYSRDELEPLRSDPSFDPLRAPGFPDDLKVGIVDTPSGNVEFVWARGEGIEARVGSSASS